jgi:N-methylhydantoinase A
MAAELGIATVIAPRMAGALSALGMLMADRARDYSAGALGVAEVEPLFRDLERKAQRDLPEGTARRFADLRYAGQSYELTVPWKGASTPELFHRLHKKVYGFCDGARATETVTVRVRAVAPVPRPDLRVKRQARKTAIASGPAATRKVWIDGRWRNAFAGPREAMPPGLGPALITDYGSTTLVPPGWKIVADEFGNLILSSPRSFRR